jgi:high affinity sulfate transporter 1
VSEVRILGEASPVRWPSARRLLPGLLQLKSYQRSWLRWDALAGITVAAYLVPQVMAYGEVAGLQPVVGLWAILPSLAIYALLGSSRQLSVGPESTTALMTATVVAPLAAGDPARYATLAAALAIVVGLLSLGAWAVRLGFISDLLSQPILVGYLTGVAAIMIVGQLGKVTGVPVEGGSLGSELWSFLHALDHFHPATFLIAVATLLFLFVVQWRFPRLAGPLLAVLLATGLTVALDLERKGVEVVGHVPAGLPHLSPPSLDAYAALLLPAVGVLLVGYTGNVLTARAFASRGGDAIDANQELLALGAANVGAGLFQGFPVSSSGSRTAVGDASGSRTQLHSVVALVCVILVLLFLRPLLAHFPVAALGAIVIYAATRLIDIDGFRRLAAFRRSELVLAIAAFVGVLVFDILYGILVAIGLSVAELLRRVARPHDAIQGRVPGLAGMHDIDDYPQAELIPGLVVYRYDSPLFFANAQDFQVRAMAAVNGQTVPVRWFVLNVEANVEVDITALDALEELRSQLTGRGIVFALARVKQDLLVPLRAFGLVDRIGADRLFPTLPTAVAAYEEWARTQGAAQDRSSPGVD